MDRRTGRGLVVAAAPFAERGARFRASFDYIEHMCEDAPAFANSFGNPRDGMDMLPTALSGTRALLSDGG